MIRYLIKNNLKLMLRNKWILLVMLLGPILVIAILSSAFEDFMQFYEGVEEFQVGYCLEEGSLYASYMEEVKSAGKEAGIDLIAYTTGDPEKIMNKNDLAAYVEFGTDRYTVYESEDHEIEGITLEYFLNRIQEERVNQMLKAYGAANAQTDPSADLQSVTSVKNEEDSKTHLPVKQIEYMPAIGSWDYYGIIYIVYFSWCCLICIAGVLGNEKKCGIDNKFRVTGVSGLRLYLVKWIPAVFVTMGEMVLATAVSGVLYQIHWGNLFVFGGILLLSIMASTSYGLMLYHLFHHMAITIICLFSTVWIMGFVGGSFQTYMFSGWADSIKDYSPIYHINRALVENSCMGHSDYIGSAILYCVAIAVICSAIAIFADGLRKRGRA